MIGFVFDLDGPFGDPVAFEGIAREPRGFQNSFRFIRIRTSVEVRQTAVNGLSSGASMIVMPPRKGASKTSIGVPKTLTPASIRWAACPQVASPIMKLVDSEQDVGIAAVWPGRAGAYRG